MAIFDPANNVITTGYRVNKLFEWDVGVKGQLQQLVDIVDSISMAQDSNQRKDQFCTAFKCAGLSSLHPTNHRSKDVQSWEQTQRTFRQELSNLHMDQVVDVTFRDKTIKFLAVMVFIVLSYEPVPSRWGGQLTYALAG